MCDPTVTLKSLYIVYDAYGTVCGEIIYHIRKAFFKGKCSACDITHGPKKEKPEFTELKGGFRVPVHNIHRDEMHVELRSAVERLPCVVGEMSDGWYEVLLEPEDLDLANGSVKLLERLVREKMEERGRSFPMRLENDDESLCDDDLLSDNDQDISRVPTA